MVTIETILPLGAALLSTGLAVSTVLGYGRSIDRLRWTFVLLNTSIVIWCSAYILQPAGHGALSSAVFVFGTPEYVAFVVTVLGMSATATYWFLFASAFTGRASMLRPSILTLLHVPLAASALAAATVPWQSVYAVPDGSTAAYGPLMPILSLSLYALVFGGIAVLLVHSSESKIRARHARIAGLIAIVPTAATLMWNLRGPLGLELQTNLGPPAFALFSAGLAWLVYREGMGEFLPSVTAAAFKYASDAAIATDENMAVIALNDAARTLVPLLREGDRIRDHLPELSERIASCAGGSEPSLSFEIQVDRRVLSGRAKTTLTPSGKSLGCVVLLTDVSVLRQAEEALESIESRGTFAE